MPHADHTRLHNFEENMDSDRSGKPRFKVGDEVKYIGPDEHDRKVGRIIRVEDGSPDLVFRYHVRFPGGATLRCFGFELILIRTEAA